MKKLIIIILLLSNFISADIEIIASPTCDVTELSAYEVKNMFMLKKRSINDQDIIIIDRYEKDTYAEFLRKYMKKTTRKMKVYWVRMLFTGKKTPPKKLSMEEFSSLDVSDKCYLSYENIKEKPINWNTVTIK